VERVVRNRSFTLYKTFYVDGAAADPTGTPTVTVTRLSDGSVVTTGAVTNEAAAGTWSVTVAATVNTLLDTLTVDWSGVVNGTAQEYLDTVEVAGGTLFTLAEARAFGITTGTAVDADVMDMRTTVEQEIEKACGCAFVPRYALETLNGSGSSSILLRPLISRVRSATVDGSAFSAGDLTGLSLGLTGTVYSASRTWSCGSSNVVVGYEHGYGDTPHGIKRAALILAKDWLGGRNSPIDERATTFGADNGISYSLAVAGRNGSHVGIPEVDATIDRYSLSVGIA
jgi:hypothetical protein